MIRGIGICGPLRIKGYFGITKTISLLLLCILSTKLVFKSMKRSL
jgi:hypothetical protein